MRWKWITGICTLLIIALMLAVYVFLDHYDYNKLKPRIARMVKDATGRELNLGGEINLAIGLSPSLVVTDVTFANASWGSQSQMIKIEKLQAQVRLLPLLFRDVELRNIGLAGVDVLLETNPSGKGNWDFSVDDSPARSAGVIKPAKIDIDNIRIENLSLTLRDGKTGSATRFTLISFDVARQEAADMLALDLRADYNGQPVALSGKTGLIRNLLAHQRFPLKLSGTFSNATVKIDGAIDDVLNLNGIDLKAQASGKNLAKLELNKNIQLPKTSAFDITGHLKGSKEALTLEDLRANLSGSAVDLAISGSFGDLITLSGMDLHLKGSGMDLAEIGKFIGEKLPATDEFAVQGRLTGSAKALSLLEAMGSASRGSVRLAVNGEIKDLSAFSGVDLKLTGSGKDLAEIGAIIGEKLPATDDFKFQGRLTGSAKTLSLSEAHGSAHRGGLSLALDGGIKDLLNFDGVDLVVKGSGKDLSEVGAIIDAKLPATDEFAVEGRLTGSGKALSLKEAQGSAKQGSLSVALSGEVKDLIAFSGLDLQLKGSGKNLAEIGSIIGEKLPATEEFAGEGRLMGSVETLNLQKAHGQARQGSLNLTVNGQIKDLLALSGMDLKLDGSGKDLSEVGPIIGEKLPATGEFTVKGRLTGSTKALALQNSQGRVSRGGLRLSLDGSIKNLIALTRIDVRFKGSGVDLAEVGTIIGEKLPTTDNFAVQGRLMGSTKALSLREAMGRVSRDGMSVAFDGGISDVLALRSINIRLKASGKELAAIGPLVGSNLPKIGPFDVSGHLIGSAKLLLLKEFSAIVDKSDFKGLAKIAFRKRPKITVRLESSVLDFTPFMRMAGKDKQEPGEEDKRERRLFPEDPLPFGALKRVDADIVVKGRNIHIRDAQLEFGHLALTLEDSNLSIDKLEATYKQTKISGNLHLDSGSPPQVATKFLVQNFDLGGLLRETGMNDQVRATVDIAAHLNGRGDSVHSLMADLDGSIGAVMGKGYLTKYLNLLSMDLSKKVIHYWGRHKKADQIKCAVVQFDIKDGVATSRAFVFNSQIGILTGEGEINLGTERVDFLLVPKPKNPGLLELSTKLRVSGTILDAKVRPDNLALLTKGALALSSLVIGPIGLLAPFVHLGAHKKHPCDIQSIGQLGLQTSAEK